MTKHLCKEKRSITLNLKRWPRNRFEAVVYFCPAQCGRVLDIGCGNGLVLYHLVEQYKEITGIEPCSKRYSAAKERLNKVQKPVEILQCRIEDGINKPDGWFDTIIWSDVIEHVIDVFGAMSEVSRLLKIGGVLVTITPNAAYLRRRIRFLFGKFPVTTSNKKSLKIIPGVIYEGGHVHYFTFDTLKAIYRQVGIRPVKTVGYGRLGRLHNILPSLLSGSVMVIGRKE